MASLMHKTIFDSSSGQRLLMFDIDGSFWIFVYNTIIWHDQLVLDLPTLNYIVLNLIPTSPPTILLINSLRQM